MQLTVYISYKHGGRSEELAKRIEHTLNNSNIGIRVIRDKNHLQYNQSIDKFIHEIGRGKYVVAVISDGYLKSAYCMKELILITQNKDFQKRLFPVVLPDADIFNNLGQNQYISYWEYQKTQQNHSLKSQASLHGVSTADIDLYDDIVSYLANLSTIRSNFSQLIRHISDINVLTIEEHENSSYHQLVQAIRKQHRLDQQFLKEIGAIDEISEEEISEINRKVDSAHELLLRGDHAKATFFLQEVLRKAPYNPKANLLHVFLNLSIKDVYTMSSETVKSLEKSLNICLAKDIVPYGIYATALYLWAVIKHDHYQMSHMKTQPTFQELYQVLTQVNRRQVDLPLFRSIKCTQKIRADLKLYL